MVSGGALNPKDIPTPRLHLNTVPATSQPKLSQLSQQSAKGRESGGLLNNAARAGQICADLRQAGLRDLLAKATPSPFRYIHNMIDTSSPVSLSTFGSTAWPQFLGSWLGSTLFSSNLGSCSMAAKNLLSLRVPAHLTTHERHSGFRGLRTLNPTS